VPVSDSVMLAVKHKVKLLRRRGQELERKFFLSHSKIREFLNSVPMNSKIPRTRIPGTTLCRDGLAVSIQRTD
jgi:hypothetical protein